MERRLQPEPVIPPAQEQQAEPQEKAEIPSWRLREMRESYAHRPATTAAEATASVVEHALETVSCAAVIVPTRTGTTARMISRFKPSAWIAAVTRSAGVRRGLAFSYGVVPIEVDEPKDWRAFAAAWTREHGLSGPRAILVAGPSERHPEANYRIEFLRLDGPPPDPGKLSEGRP